MDTTNPGPIEQDQGLRQDQATGQDNILSPYVPEEIRQVDAFACQNGLKVFPVSASGNGKQPCCKGWLSESTSEPEKLFDSHLGRVGRFGLPCKSNGLIVVDCDVKDTETKGNGIEQFHAYCEKHGLPLSPVWQSTPSGGRHYFYKADFPEVIRGRTKITLDGEPTNIDIRSPGAADGDGNYVVSDLSGRSGYEWHGDWSQIISLPPCLVEELKEKPLQATPEERIGGIGGDVPERIVRILEKRVDEIAKTPEGERNSTVFKLSCKICRWLLPFPGEWEKWEPRILEAAQKTGLSPQEAKMAIEQGRKSGEASGPYAPERYQVEDGQNGENSGNFAELPKQAFSERLWRVINALAAFCSTSLQVALACLMALAAECLGYNRSIKISRDKLQRSNLWIVVVSSTGSGKTTCFTTVTRRLREIQTKMREEREKEVKIWEEWQNLSKAEKKERINNGETVPQYPKAVGIIVKDMSPESPFEVFESYPRSVLYNADEMRGFFGSHNRYQSSNVGSANSDLLLPTFDSNPIDIWRKTKDNQNRQIVLERGTLTLIGNIQPGLFKKLFSSDDFEQGWPQRCIYFIAPEPKPLLWPEEEEDSDPCVNNDIMRMTDRLWAAGGQVGSTEIDRECLQYLKPYCRSLALSFMEQPYSKMRGFSIRFYWITFRILNVLLYLEWSLSSEQEPPKRLYALQAYRGVKLCRWLITNAASLFLGGNGSNGADDTNQNLKKDIAKIVTAHESDIFAEDRKVPSSVFRRWLEEGGLGDHADQFFTKTLNAMNITAGKVKVRKIINGVSTPVCVKFFPDDALALCRKLAKAAPMLFAELDELAPPQGSRLPAAHDAQVVPAAIQPEISESPETKATADLAPAAQPEKAELPEAMNEECPPQSSPVAIRAVSAKFPEVTVESDLSQAVLQQPQAEIDYSNPHNFAHLHLHTDASFQDAILTVDEAFEQAKKCNMTALAITDHGNLHNARKFYLAARAAGIHPVLGCEIYVKNDGIFPPPPDGTKAKSSFHLTLLAETQEGWNNLLSLQKHSFNNLHYKKPLVSHDFLASHARGLIGMSACLGGEIPQAILQGHDPKPILEWYEKAFGENSFFLERMENGYTELQIVNPALCALSQVCGVPIVATSDVHYLAPEDRETYLVNSMRDWQLKNGESVADHGREAWSLHFRTAEEMRAAHGNQTEELELAGKIAARCNVELPEPGKDKFFMPSGEVIVGEKKEPAQILKDKAFEGLSALGLDDRTEYVQRLEYELAVITQKGFENYILMIADMIGEAKRKGIVVGPGRGSGAGSLLCYVLGITQLDPIKYGLLFERFINLDRMSLPDIDVDYDEERRGEILDYLRTKYGPECVTAIGTITTRKAKQAIKDAVKNLMNDREPGMSQKDWTGLGEKLSACVPDQCEKTISELENAGAFAGMTSPAASRILKIASRLEGLGRHPGQHACGYAVSPHPLDTAMPLRCAVKDGPMVTQWTKDEVEAAGYVKLDAIGSLTMTRIRKTEEKIRTAGKPEPSYSPDDRKTFDLFKSGETVGVFQMASDGMRKLVMKVKPESLQDITVAIAGYRPGPLSSGMVEHLLKRRNGKEEVSYFGLDEMLRPILEETYGVIVYQEQVMQIGQAVAGFTAAEADALREAMSKKKMDIMAQKKVLFIAGAMQKGVSEEKAASLFGMMEKFAEYGFNKSHAAAYALISYQTAYLKANYPSEFLAACCETIDENLSARSIAAECARLGIEKKDLPTKCDLPGFGEHPLKAYGSKGDGMLSVTDLVKGQSATIRVYAENVHETTVTKGASAGQKMGMGKVSDETGIVSFVAFPKAWNAGKIKQGKCYILSGVIQMRDKMLQLIVNKAEELSPRPA